MNNKDIIQQYYLTKSLPENTDKESLCQYLLENIFPEKSVDLFNGGSVSMKSISPFPIGDYGCDYSVVESARTSLGQGLKNTADDQKLINFLWKNKHLTPFEHIFITMRVVCPIALSKHFMRHRTFSFNEISARYAPVDGNFYIPDTLRMQATKNRQCSTDQSVEDSVSLIEEMKTCYEMCKTLYDKMLESGVSREQARFILPQSTYTTFYMSGNLRNWLHFLDLREASDAQYEMQQYAHAIHSLIQPYIPMTENIL
jgi:thymidylate synthase (FAD)